MPSIEVEGWLKSQVIENDESKVQDDDGEVVEEQVDCRSH